MPKQTSAQKKTISRVMHESKHGELKSGGSGKKVKNKKQAIAIALSEASASKYKSKAENKRNLAHTKANERKGKTGKATKESHHHASA